MPNQNENILARWQTALATGVCSPLEFFDRVENSLTASGLPELKISRITRSESGWFAPRRIYLRVRYQKLYFDISAFIAGDSLIVGWWLHEDVSGITDLLAELPGFGFLIGKTIRAATYYTVDFIEYFQRALHNSILRVIDELSEENGIMLSPEENRQPLWEEIW